MFNFFISTKLVKTVFVEITWQVKVRVELFI